MMVCTPSLFETTLLVVALRLNCNIKSVRLICEIHIQNLVESKAPMAMINVN